MQNNDELIAMLQQPGGERLLEKLLAEKSLLEFAKQAWHVVEPGTEFIDNWHLAYLEEELMLLVLDRIEDIVDIPQERIEQLKEHELKRRVCLNVPPRTMKSLFFNVFFPCWVWIHDPSVQFITVSYSVDLSIELNKKRRNIIQSDWFIERWGNKIKISDDQNTKTYFENEQRGSMFATSVGGTLTGKGADIILLDKDYLTSPA